MDRTTVHYEADVPKHVVKKIVRIQCEDLEGSAGWVTRERHVSTVFEPIAERLYLDAERTRHNQLRADYVAWIDELDAAVAALG